MIALDTNILIYAHRAGTLEHKAARRAVLSAMDDPRGAGIPYPCVAEFWSVVTSPPLPKPSTPSEARAFLLGLWDAGVEVWCPDSGFSAVLAELAVEERATGRQIFDLQIALLARNHGATEIWTHDAGFPPVPGLRVVDPLKAPRQS
jgi:toxin-antitoxin system PIN domain toxin